MRDKTYENVSELETDMKWFVHNCRTMFPRVEAVQKAAKELLRCSNEEIECIQVCADCYINAFQHPETSFALPCETPHTLIWAKAEGFIYWPAKAMAVDEENLVKVRFFGDHTVSVVPALNCYLYSKDHPEDSSDCGYEELYDLAVKVHVLIIINIQSK